MKVEITLWASDEVFNSGNATEGQKDRLELGQHEMSMVSLLGPWLSIGDDRDFTIAVQDHDTGYWVPIKTIGTGPGKSTELPDRTRGVFSDINIKPVPETTS